MSSQQDRASWNEVMLSPEAENGGEGSVRQEPEEVSGFASAAQPEGELSPATPPAQDSEPALHSFDEAQEEEKAEPSAWGTPRAEETPANSEIAESESSEAVEDQSLMESIGSAPALAPGEIVQGLVLKLTDEEVFVGLGLKSEAIVPRGEFLSEDGQLNVAVGDTVDVVVEKFDELTGTAVVSRRKAIQEKLWEEIERVFYEELPVRGRVLERIKGGLSVDVGVRAFLPSSQADLKAHPNLEELIGQEITCKITKLDRKRNNVVVSRRKLLEEENERTKQETLDKLAEGAVLKGRVKNLTSYGAFVDVGGLDGLLHLTDLSWTRVAQPSEVVEVGQEIEVKVLKFDKEKGRVSLGLKQLTPDPWEQVVSHFHPGDHATGRVVSLTDYGAFVELEPGVEGLIHISEMSWGSRLKHPSKILKPGDQVEVTVLGVNLSQRRISLSLKQTLPDPWAGLSERMGPGTVVQGRVRHFTEFGAFVEVEEGVDGLIHVSNLSWTKNVKHPSEVLRKGQQIEAVVLNVDPKSRRLSLGLKQLQPDAWENFFGKTKVGDVVHAKVTRRTSFGLFAEIEEGIEGLCHISEIEDSQSGSDRGGPKVGSELDFRVVRLNPEEKKIALSLRMSGSKAPEARKRAPEPVSLSRMAEALSSAGITTATVSRGRAAEKSEDLE